MATPNNVQSSASSTAHKAQDAASSAVDTAKQAGQAALDQAKHLGSQVADAATHYAGQAAEQARHLAGQAASAASGYATDAQRAAASGLRTVGGYIEQGSDYLQHQDFQGIAGDLTALIRRNPIPSLLIGLGIGFLLARATVSSWR